jgi:hypothetical protein
MRRAQAPSYPVSIFIAGDYDEARDICRAFCDEEGLCVTVTPTAYIYTGGEEAGVIVGLINYPRFPTQPRDIDTVATLLALELMHKLEQESVTVQTPEITHWFSIRTADLASAGEAGTATDSEAGVAEGEHATVEDGDAQTSSSRDCSNPGSVQRARHGAQGRPSDDQGCGSRVRAMPLRAALPCFALNRLRRFRPPGGCRYRKRRLTMERLVDDIDALSDEPTEQAA